MTDGGDPAPSAPVRKLHLCRVTYCHCSNGTPLPPRPPMRRGERRDRLVCYWLMMWYAGRKMDGADVARSLWSVEAVPDTALQESLHIDFVWGGGRLGRVCRHSGNFYCILELPEMLLRAPALR